MPSFEARNIYTWGASIISTTVWVLGLILSAATSKQLAEFTKTYYNVPSPQNVYTPVISFYIHLNFFCSLAIKSCFLTLKFLLGFDEPTFMILVVFVISWTALFSLKYVCRYVLPFRHFYYMIVYTFLR